MTLGFVKGCSSSLEAGFCAAGGVLTTEGAGAPVEVTGTGFISEPAVAAGTGSVVAGWLTEGATGAVVAG